MLKPTALALFSLVLTGAAASAKDTPPRPAEQERPVETKHDWSGFYAGVNGGAGTSTERSRSSAPADPTSGFGGHARP